MPIQANSPMWYWLTSLPEQWILATGRCSHYQSNGFSLLSLSSLREQCARRKKAVCLTEHSWTKLNCATAWGWCAWNDVKLRKSRWERSVFERTSYILGEYPQARLECKTPRVQNDSNRPEARFGANVQTSENTKSNAWPVVCESKFNVN